MKLVRVCFAIALFTLVSSSANAAVIGVTNAAAIYADSTLNLATLGSDYTDVAQGTALAVTGPYARRTTFTSGLQRMSRVDEGTTWGGDFATGDPLLWAGGFDANYNMSAGGALTLTFNGRMRAVGARIQGRFYEPFTATILAYGANGILGQYTINSLAIGNASNTAPFLGIIDTTNSITHVTFSVSSAQSRDDFAIGGVQATVPEPFTLSLVALGVAGAIVRRRLA